MATRMLQRRGTAAEWATVNPILDDGEIGFERDTRVFKIGDGVTAWNALKHVYVRQVGGDTIAAAAPGTIPLVVKSAAGQTASLFEAHDDVGTVLAQIYADGRLATKGLSSTPATTGNTGLALTALPGQVADVLRTVDSAAATLFGVRAAGEVYVTPRDAASPHPAVVVNAISPGSAVLRTKAAAGQTGNIFEAQDSAGAMLARITNAGRLVVESVGYFGPNAGSTVGVGSVRVMPAATNDVGLTVRGLAAQARELIRLEDSAGSPVSVWGPDGVLNLYMGNARMRVGYIGDYGTVRMFNDLAATAAGQLTGRILTYGKDSLGNETIYTDQRSLTETITDGAEDGYYDIYTSTSGVLKATVRFGQNGHAQHLWINKTTQKGLVVRSTPSQTAHLAEFQNSAGSVLAGVSAAGHVFVGSQNGGSVKIGSAAFGYTAGDRPAVIFTNTSHTATNVSGGGILYTESGRLFYRGELGTVTQLGPA